ncbi:MULTISPECIES: hypothetical protein [Nocardia]|nr:MULTISPECIES: hypothetical protein [Nocardia]
MNSGPRTDAAQNSDTDRDDVDHLPDSDEQTPTDEQDQAAEMDYEGDTPN